MIYIICAIGKNNEIGKDNKLLWHLKKDMQFFKRATLNHNVVMGKNTYLSIGKALENRTNYVISSTIDPKDAIVLKSVNEVFDIKGDTFIIGGAKLYEEFIDKANIMYLTHIEDEKDADTYFPKFNKDDYDITTLEYGQEEDISYEIKKYVRKKY